MKVQTSEALNTRARAHKHIHIYKNM